MIRKNNKLRRSAEEGQQTAPRPGLTCFLGHPGQYPPPPGHVTCVNMCVGFSVLRSNPPFPLRTPAFTRTRDTLGLGCPLGRRPRLGHIESCSRVSYVLSGGGGHSESLSMPASACPPWVITCPGVLPNPQPPYGKLDFCVCGIEMYEFFLHFGY